MYNFFECSKNYSKTTGSLWSYSDHIANSELFKYKSSITGKTSNANQENDENTKKGNTKTKKNLEIVVPLKHLSNFCRTLDIPLINCEASLTLTWSENCVLTDTTTPAAVAVQVNNAARSAINAPTNATFQITEKTYTFWLLLYQLRLIRNSWKNWEQDLRELLNGINLWQRSDWK